jgi:hypothetical protein
MTGPARLHEATLIDGDKYLRTSSGLMVNISELVRMSNAVEAAIKPGMSEADIDALIHATVKRMSPN